MLHGKKVNYILKKYDISAQILVSLCIHSLQMHNISYVINSYICSPNLLTSMKGIQKWVQKTIQNMNSYIKLKYLWILVTKPSP